ncbi:MAG: DUF4351 domain-containing protein [Thiocapsa sp.]|uniref:DUF4351 domain-containing protein n=1 Tax=Thiocapsa sp. TaxID=2024551 RepID=UPI001BCF25C2|nr:DUF4351 domain-containing protein [Thiocapsa sp.]QVL50228.1 MAG: DUF4351 domain-containing protein [Thiocapsa sp.]
MQDENEWELDRQRYPQAANTMTGDAARLTEQGRHEGEIDLGLRQLRRRLGQVPEPHRQRIQSLPSEQLETLGEDLLDFTSTLDLDTWLSRH